MLSKNKISDILIKIGAIKSENIEKFSSKTRDVTDLVVCRDKISKVIYIDNFYVGSDEYKDARYINESSYEAAKYEDLIDSERRFNSFKQFIAGKSIVDFGCGRGSFLELCNSVAKSAAGVELHQSFIDDLKIKNISCFDDLKNAPGNQDTFFLFHSLEHIPNPLDFLKEIRDKLKKNGQGKIVIEVPSATDFLIDVLRLDSFIDSTLWSQHLVLYTRDSIRLLLQHSGFTNILITGVQRYNFSNHVNWIMNNKPGGHKSVMSVFETDDLTSAYAAALSRIDANDTLIAIAEVGE